MLAALRKLESGQTPGEDGVLADIIRTAADAVSTSKSAGADVQLRHVRVRQRGGAGEVRVL